VLCTLACLFWCDNIISSATYPPGWRSCAIWNGPCDQRFPGLWETFIFGSSSGFNFVSSVWLFGWSTMAPTMCWLLTASISYWFWRILSAMCWLLTASISYWFWRILSGFLILIKNVQLAVGVGSGYAFAPLRPQKGLYSEDAHGVMGSRLSVSAAWCWPAQKHCIFVIRKIYSIYILENTPRYCGWVSRRCWLVHRSSVDSEINIGILRCGISVATKIPL
jgi:hypothetical protein